MIALIHGTETLKNLYIVVKVVGLERTIPVPFFRVLPEAKGFIVCNTIHTKISCRQTQSKGVVGGRINTELQSMLSSGSKDWHCCRKVSDRFW